MLRERDELVVLVVLLVLFKVKMTCHLVTAYNNKLVSGELLQVKTLLTQH